MFPYPNKFLAYFYGCLALFMVAFGLGIELTDRLEAQVVTNPSVTGMTSSTIQAGSGGAAATINGTLTTSTTSTCTTAVITEEDLWTYTVPAATLSADGKGLRVTVYGTKAANVNTVTGRFYVAGVVASTFFTSSTSGDRFVLVAEVLRNAATTYSGARATQLLANSSGNVISGSATWANANIIKVTGQNGTASAGDMCVTGAIVETIK